MILLISLTVHAELQKQFLSTNLTDNQNEEDEDDVDNGCHEDKEEGSIDDNQYGGDDDDDSEQKEEGERDFGYLDDLLRDDEDTTRLGNQIHNQKTNSHQVGDVS